MPLWKGSGMTRKRIAIGGFEHETNTFAPSPAGYDDFALGSGFPPLSTGEEIAARCRGNLPIAGFLSEGEARGWELVPTLWAAATPSAHVTRQAFERILADLVSRIAAAGPLDGVLLDLHGAMVAQDFDDGEGEILRRVRAIVGPDVPIVASLDLHGNVSAEMVEMADAMVAFRTYPHVDMAETGRRAAQALARILETGRRPAKAFRQLPFLTPIVFQCTFDEPMRGIYAKLAAMEAQHDASLSVLPCFPAADIACCLPSVLAYAGDQAKADALADELAAFVLSKEGDFKGELLSPEDAARRAQALVAQGRRPVVIADAQDNPGAGGDSDTTGLLRALVAADAQKAALGLIADPDAARAAHQAGVGAEIELTLGGRSGVVGDAPFKARFVVEALSDGEVLGKGPYYKDILLKLGPCAALRIGGVRIAVSTRKAQLADREMFRFLGIVPEEMDILAVKSAVHFRADFEPMAGALLIACAPGPMPMDPAALPWTKLPEGVRLGPLGKPFRR